MTVTLLLRAFGHTELVRNGGLMASVAVLLFECGKLLNSPVYRNTC